MNRRGGVRTSPETTERLPAESPSPPPTWTRRGFLQSTLGGLLAAGTAACTDLGFNDDDDTLFDGPRIDEADFIAYNASYYDAAVDARTQFPHSYIADGRPAGETDPVAIAFRLQYLLDQGSSAAATVETLLDHLLAAQSSGPPPRNYRNLLPPLAFTASEPGVEPATRDFFVINNTMLSARVAMAAHAFRGTALEDKALAFLDKQKEGYNELLSRTSGFLPTFGNAGTRSVEPHGLDLLFGGFVEGIAFVLAYFIGGTTYFDDPDAGLGVWRAMNDVQNTFVGEHPAATKSLSIPVHLARNGSGFQYFHPLLAVQPDALHPSMHDALYNVLYSYLDASTYDRVPGIYSAGPRPGGGFILDNGLNRLAAHQRFQGSQETVVTIDALVAAMRLFPDESDERETLRGWIGRYVTLTDMTSPNGYFGAVDKEGRVVRALYARQNGAMILLNSNAAAHLDGFLQDHGRPTMSALIGQITLTHRGAPVRRVEAPLPLPPNPDGLFTHPRGS